MHDQQNETVMAIAASSPFSSSSIPLTFLAVCILTILVLIAWCRWFLVNRRSRAAPAQQEHHHHQHHRHREDEEKVPSRASASSHLPAHNFIALFPDLKIMLLPIDEDGSRLRSDDTAALMAHTRCCATVASSRCCVPLSSHQRSSSSTSSSPLRMASSIVLMRHFERLDHVQPGWFANSEAAVSTVAGAGSSTPSPQLFYPHDPPLSPAGIRDGSAFAQGDLQRRVLAQRHRVDDRFTFVVSSPSLRCLLTACIVANAINAPVVIDERCSDWVNRKVFGDSLPETTLKRKKTKNNSNSSSTCYWELDYRLVGTKNNSNNAASASASSATSATAMLASCRAIFQATAERAGSGCPVLFHRDGAPAGTETAGDCVSRGGGSLCFFDAQCLFDELRGRDRCCSLHGEEDNDNKKVFEHRPETERDVADRVSAALWDLSRPLTVSPSAAGQKSFSIKSLTQPPPQQQQHHAASATFRLLSSSSAARRCRYAPRLLVVTHADIIRVAAGEITPRCRASPVSHNGISVAPGSLSHFVRIGSCAAENAENADDDQHYHFHLACYGSKQAAAIDCLRVG